MLEVGRRERAGRGENFNNYTEDPCATHLNSSRAREISAPGNDKGQLPIALPRRA